MQGPDLIPEQATGAPRGEEGLGSLSIVIPVFNEADALEDLYAEIERACESTDRPWELIWVDDGSTDHSPEVLERMAIAQRSVRVIQLRRNFGKSAALRAGFEASRGQIVVTLDGDGQDDPAEIPALVTKLNEGYNVVSGWKKERRDPFFKRLGSRVFNGMTARLSGVPLHDVNCGMKAYDGASVRDLELYGEQHRLIPVIGYQRGWQIAELAVNHRPRTQGRSKFGPERYVRGLLDLFGVLFIGRYQYRPLHLFGGSGLVAMFLGVVTCLYLTGEKLFEDEAIGGRPLLLLGVLLILGGIQLFTIGLVSEMIAATRQDVRRGRSTAQLVGRRMGHDELPPLDQA